MDKIVSVDRYSKPINLSYKNKDSFGTLFGGIMSIATYVALTLYAYLILRIMYERTGTDKDFLV